MNKHLLLCTFLLLFFTAQSQSQSGIVHKDFGEGWVIALNDNVAVDMDEDGQRDFFINRVDGELGFTGIYARGCFVSPSSNAMTSFGSRALKIFNEGELIQMDDDNIFDYIEEDGSTYSVTEGYAEGFSDHEDYYIGVALLDPNLLAKNAWIKISIDSEAQELIIKEWAYTTVYAIGQGGILSGDNGTITTTNELLDIKDIVVSPNPIVDRMDITYDYNGQEALTIAVYNTSGVNVYQQLHRNHIRSTEINTESWTAGSYIVSFLTKTGVIAKQVVVVD